MDNRTLKEACMQACKVSKPGLQALSVDQAKA
jgi:hypothetical protein